MRYAWFGENYDNDGVQIFDLKNWHYAGNNYNYMWAANATPLAEIGNLNVRFSFNIDPGPRLDPLNKPHYNFGFTAVGAVPYRYPNMAYTNPRRRPPQTVTRIDWKQGIGVGMRYPARETGFTWDESRSVWRWEGEFWIYERIYLSNTRPDSALEYEAGVLRQVRQPAANLLFGSRQTLSPGERK